MAHNDPVEHAGGRLREALEHALPRRTLLAGAAAAAGVAALGAHATAAAQTPPPEVPEDTTKLQGRPTSELGVRSQFEQPRRAPNRSPQGSSGTPHQDLHGIITPADLHFERHHAGIPEIDPARYELLIHGMVDRPRIFTLEDLKRFPTRSTIYFLECSGNGGAAYRNVQAERTPQAIDPLTSTSEWTGVLLSTLFREVGVQSGATWFLAEGQDGSVMTRSIPVEKGMQDAMIAWGQNGEAIRPEQGYPARLLLPGWEGNSNVKWLRRIELSNEPFMTREETSKYTDPLPDCTARMFSFEMDAKSLITFPAFPLNLSPGWWEVEGLAWTGRGKITRVDVSTDGGKTWAQAQLQEPVLPLAHVRFRFPWTYAGGEAMLLSRATDETGYVQPTLDVLTAARGAGTQYHYNNLRGWKVDASGKITFATA
jgi:sulfane dehydrogenase subunit SoxC